MLLLPIGKSVLLLEKQHMKSAVKLVTSLFYFVIPQHCYLCGVGQGV